MAVFHWLQISSIKYVYIECKYLVRVQCIFTVMYVQFVQILFIAFINEIVIVSQFQYNIDVDSSVL